MTINVYAKAGESLQQIGGELPGGWVTMISQRPEGDYIASDDGEWVIRQSTYAEELAELNRKYSSRRLGLCQAWLVAGVAGGADEATIKTEVSVEIDSLDAKYVVDVNNLKHKHGVV